MRSKSGNNRGFYVLALGVLCFGQPLWAQPTWYTAGTGGFNPQIPDFYQHQNWSSTVANGWENSPNRSGWCYYTAFADTFYDLTKQGYTGLLVSDVTNPAKWFNDMYNPGDIPNSELSELAHDSDMSNVQDYLDAAGHSSTDTNPLLYNQFDVAANGTVTTSIFSYKDLFTFLNVKAEAGDDVVIKLSGGTVAPVPSDQAGRWWNFHCVALAGIDVASKTVFVADPDTNQGSALANAGWPKLATFPGALASKNTDPIPIPTAPVAGTAASYNTYYTGFQLNNKNIVASIDSAYYNGTVVTDVDTISAPKGKLVSAAPSGGTEETSLAINSGSGTVDKVLIVPTSQLDNPSADPGMFSFTSSGSTWTDIEDTTDAMGDVLPDFGIEYDLSGGTGLLPGEIATADLGTAGDFSTTGYDILLHFSDDAPDVWDAEVYDQPFDTSDPSGLQDNISPEPEPTAGALLLCVLPFTLKRTRRAKTVAN